MVVVRAELTMVHKNMVKLRTMPIINEITRITKNDKELLCNKKTDCKLEITKSKMQHFVEENEV